MVTSVESILDDDKPIHTHSETSRGLDGDQGRAKKALGLSKANSDRTAQGHL